MAGKRYCLCFSMTSCFFIVIDGDFNLDEEPDSSLDRLFSRTVDDFSGPGAGVMAVVDHDSAVDQHVIDPLGILLRILIRRRLAYPVRVQHDNVSPVTFFQEASIFKS